MRGVSIFSTQPLLRMKSLHEDKAIHPKLPIEVHFKWRVNITSIGHQSKSRNKMWVLNHLIWLASIGNRGFKCEFISLDSIGMALWSIDQKGEPYGLITWRSRSRHIPRGNTSEVVLTREYDGLHMVPLPGSCGWDRWVIKNDPFSSNHSFLNFPWDMISRKIKKNAP